MNKAVFDTNDQLSGNGRKIDLLLKFNGHDKVELGSNEWKKSSVSKDVILKQQTKNLRINGSIISTLMNKYGNEFNKIMAMDWVGK